MCGIMAYVGPQDALPIVLDGLRRLEYRGYDSAGVAVLTGNSSVTVRRAPGKLENLTQLLGRENGNLRGHVAIGHTRWATHG
ncbi:MAG TPA: glutamine--fructose-6-phosphate aminotransferase, partial [Chloroflexota bacterium]|nr:glutamine--fructose-6-phosphate aminotransferase [Chloroflexota bacterium]